MAIDDVVRVNERVISKSGPLRRARRVAVLAWSPLVGFAGYTLFSQGNPLRGLLVAALMASATALLSVVLGKRARRGAIRRFLLEQTGGRTSWPVSTTVGPDGITLTQLGDSSTMAWDALSVSADRGGALVLDVGPGAAAEFRASSFDNPREGREILAAIRAGIAGARVG